MSRPAFLFIGSSYTRFLSFDGLMSVLTDPKNSHSNSTLNCCSEVFAIVVSFHAASLPGGLLWDETLDIIRIAAKNSKIVGADINELSPIKGFNSYNFLVAKLAYKILSYKFLY